MHTPSPHGQRSASRHVASWAFRAAINLAHICAGATSAGPHSQPLPATGAGTSSSSSSSSSAGSPLPWPFGPQPRIRAPIPAHDSLIQLHTPPPRRHVPMLGEPVPPTTSPSSEFGADAGGPRPGSFSPTHSVDDGDPAAAAAAETTAETTAGPTASAATRLPGERGPPSRPTNAPTMDQRQFERNKRLLMLLLDQAVAAKMKVTKVFPKKLAALGDLNQYGLNWHPGFRDPPRFVPPLDCDPYRGACAVSGCACDIFQTWPTDDGLYVYNPDTQFAESQLCRVCHHPKTEHVLATTRSRSGLPEFSPENVSKYAVKWNPERPPEHPADVPLYALSRFYKLHPDHPGASSRTHMASLAEAEEGSSATRRRGGTGGTEGGGASLADADVAAGEFAEDEQETAL